MVVYAGVCGEVVGGVARQRGRRGSEESGGHGLVETGWFGMRILDTHGWVYCL